MSIYYAQLIDVLTAAGVQCAVHDVNAGWETRARSSGGFAAPPLGVTWHHTASQTSPQNDLNWMIHSSDDAPIGNMLLDRDGIVWPIAAGAANTQGKGGPATFSRGTVPVDAGNSQLWGLEVANNGVGEPWPQVQVDAYFKASNALNALFGNLPSDVITHQVWAPTRKVDPATAAAVEGPWLPAAVTSSGTWALDDIAHECARRAVPHPEPIPPEDPVTDDDINRIAWAVWSLQLGADGGLSASILMQTAAGAYQAATDAPGRTVNFPVPIGNASADLWSVIVDTYLRVQALEAKVDAL